MNIKVLFKIENYKTYIKIPIYNYEGFHFLTLAYYISTFKSDKRYSNIKFKEINEGN